VFTPDSGGTTEMTADAYFVEADYFDLYGLRVLRGRLFEPYDVAKEVIVSERVAAAFWPGRDPINHVFRFQDQAHRVIGVVADARFPSLDRALDRPQIYLRLKKVANTAMLTLKCAAACPEPLAVNRHLAGSASTVRIQSVRRLALAYERELARPRLVAAMAMTFAAGGLLAAMAGLFSLMSQTVARRRREYGIRLALGASPTSIRALVCREGLRVGLPGLVAGCLLLVWLQRFFSSLLYRASVPDGATVLPVLVLITGVAAAALWLPARLAARSEPSVLLREP
jgi:putative ABC transport system permease protein